jgi:hypothetical protein
VTKNVDRCRPAVSTAGAEDRFNGFCPMTALHHAAPRHLKSGDARRQPQQAYGIACDHVAGVVHAEIQPADTNRYRQKGHDKHDGELRTAPLCPEDHEQIGKHAVTTSDPMACPLGKLKLVRCRKVGA